MCLSSDQYVCSVCVSDEEYEQNNVSRHARGRAREDLALPWSDLYPPERSFLRCVASPTRSPLIYFLEQRGKNTANKEEQVGANPEATSEAVTVLGRTFLK